MILNLRPTNDLTLRETDDLQQRYTLQQRDYKQNEIIMSHPHDHPYGTCRDAWTVLQQLVPWNKLHIKNFSANK